MPLPTTPTLSRAGRSSENQNTLASMLHARAFPDQGASEFSATVSVQTLADTLAPKTVTGLAATGVIGGNRLGMVLPTQNADDTTLTDLKWLVIYYDPSDSIDVGDPGTYTGTFIIAAASQWTDRTAPTTAARYYVVVARDDAGNNSVQSAEVYATALESTVAQDIPTDATGAVFDGNPRIGDGCIGILFDDILWESFLEWEVQFAVSSNSGVSWGAWTALTKTSKHSYIHKGLTTTSTYRYKYRGRPTGKNQASTVWDDPTGAGTGWPSGGTWGSDNSAIVVELVMAENMVAVNEIRTDHLEANSVTGAKINADEIVAGHIQTDAITTIKINGLAVASTKLGALSVVDGKVAARAVRTGALLIDSYIDMNSNNIWECADIRNASALTSKAINLASNYWVGYLSTTDSRLTLDADASLTGYNDLTLDAQAGDLYLKAGNGVGDYIIMEIYGASSQLQIQDWIGSGGGIGHEGYIKIYLMDGSSDWVTRYIHLEEAA